LGKIELVKGSRYANAWLVVLTRESTIVTIKLLPQCPIKEPASEPTHAGPPPTPADTRQPIEESDTHFDISHPVEPGLARCE
jgi:hypothetical protein